jgi:hypothetical protein
MMTVQKAREAAKTAPEILVAFTLEVDPTTGDPISAGFIPIARKFVLRELARLEPGAMTSGRLLDDGRLAFDARAHSDENGVAL